jgi:hypothetical protein
MAPGSRTDKTARTEVHSSMKLKNFVEYDCSHWMTHGYGDKGKFLVIREFPDGSSDVQEVIEAKA